MKNFYVLMDAAGEAPPAGGAPADPPAPPAGDPPAPPAGDPPKAADPSLLALGKAEVAKDDPLAPKDDHSWIPEKYRVMEGEKGKEALNIEASMKKVAEAHQSLEKRAGELGLPPEKPADYKVALPDGSKLKAEDFEGPQMDAFKERAHKAGMTQKQFDSAVSAHIESLNSFVSGLAEQSAQMAKDELAKDTDWQGEKLTPQLKLAYKTFNAYATKEEAAEIDRIGNNPVFLKVLARIGKDVGEDRLTHGAGNSAALGGDALSEYMKAGGPYWDAKHPDHAKYKDIVTRHFQATHGTAPIASGQHG